LGENTLKFNEVHAVKYFGKQQVIGIYGTPTVADIPPGSTAVYTNLNNYQTFLYANVGGTLLKIQLQ